MDRVGEPDRRRGVAPGGRRHDSIGAMDAPSDVDRARRLVLANLAAAIERAAVDLALAEEPAGFLAALEAGAPGPASASPPGAA
jgi:hypothetical protein